MRSFYVTTPIYYVNARPHLGHSYTTVVCDVLARYHRLEGRSVHFLTGTDEHGQKIERAATERGLAPIAHADEIVAGYQALWERLGISHDDFIRTTEPRHRLAVEEIIRRIAAAGDLYSGRHDGWYCTSCELFYTEKELVDGKRCPVHDSEAEWRSEENVFFRLSRYETPLLEWFASHPEFVRPESRFNEVKRFVEAGLRDLSVSRAGLKWGIPFPGHEGQAVYVWLDALTNYVSALGFGREAPADDLWNRFWGGGEREVLHIVGKDILRFHTIYWPAFLLSAGLPLPDTIWVHGWWLVDQRKISKSGARVVPIEPLIDRFGADAVRYFLLRDMVFGQDAGFSDEAFVERYNSDLANGLGNTVSRLVTLSRRAFDGRTPPCACDDNPLKEGAAAAVEKYRDAMAELQFDRALRAVSELVGQVNQYLVEREPWKLIRQEEQRETLSRILWNGLEAVRVAACALSPVMPTASSAVLAAIGAEPPAGWADLAWGGLAVERPLPESEALFPRIDKDKYLAALAADTEADASEEEQDPVISIDRFFETELRVATIVAAAAVPKSDKLLQLTVDLGSSRRTVVAGIAKQYGAADLVGRQVVVVANLEPAKLMGIESQGMVLAASDDGEPVLLHPERPVPDGTRVR
ncbi:MAG: methionine--tRNA ligase [Acidobacteriota bacterium]|nr:methionine--tRNA ligase [Acidobacteriota bacterium]MDH3523386.1 methionine--tRNA ligase [Acidobacteriota bacterium]